MCVRRRTLTGRLEVAQTDVDTARFERDEMESQLTILREEIARLKASGRRRSTIENGATTATPHRREPPAVEQVLLCTFFPNTTPVCIYVTLMLCHVERRPCNAYVWALWMKPVWLAILQYVSASELYSFSVFTRSTSASPAQSLLLWRHRFRPYLAYPYPLPPPHHQARPMTVAAQHRPLAPG